MRKIIVTGGRDFDDWAMLSDTLDFLNPDVVVQGGASGADRMAKEWAKENKKEVVTVEADWKTHGKAAGPIRNGEMLDAHPDACLVAFPGGKGTANCVKQAVQKNMIVLSVSA